MKATRILALLLALAMLFALGACGKPAAPAAEEPAAEEPAAEEPAAEEPAAEEPAAEEPAAETIDPLTILFSSTFQQGETGGVIIQYFIDQLAEMTGGAITVDITWGGTLFDSMGEFDAVSQGAVNMVALGHMPHTGTLNYLGFPGFAPGGTQKALDYFDEIMFVNPETSALVQGEAAEYNMKYLNVIAGGTNALCTSYAFTDLASMQSGSASFGNFMAAQWEYLGFQVTALAPPDIYDAFNRGLIDATQMGLAPMVALAWYEVAPFWALDGTYTAGNPFTVNLDWWNGLTVAQQDAIQAAADATEAYSATIYDDAIATDIAFIEEQTGNPFVEFNEADIAMLWEACFEATATSALANAEANGKTEGMVKVLQVAADFTNYDWQYAG